MIQQKIGHIIFSIGFCLMSISSVWAQENESIKIISHRTADKILLRWAPSTAGLWRSANATGYSLERFTILRDSSRVFPPQKSILDKHLKPATLSDWEIATSKNKYAAIIAQAIYGTSFQIDLPKNEEGVLNAIRLSQDQQARYSYTLLATDLSFEMAQMAGLGYEDTSIDDAEAYLYKIYPNSGPHLIDTGYVFVPVRESPPLPKMLELEGEFGDKVVNLTWSVSHMQTYYTGYFLEKSTNGEDFERIDEPATISSQDQVNSDSRYMFKSDSLKDNSQKYYYRVRGISPFGIVGPPSDLIVGQGKTNSDFEVWIKTGQSNSKGITVTWDIRQDSILEHRISKTVVAKSIDAKVFSEIISFSGLTKTYLDTLPASSNYYQVQLEDHGGRTYKSLPFFVGLEDSIPPGIPIELSGVCDSLGIIKLAWAPVQEEDLAGYRVFRSLTKEGEYRQLTSSPVSQTMYYDTLNLNTLVKRVYYKVEAVDYRENRSQKSQPATIKVYDLVPPAPPRIIGYRLDKGVITIDWVGSASDDVARYFLYKINEANELVKIQLNDLDGNINNEYKDSILVNGRVEYFLTALDSSYNISEKSNKITVNVVTDKKEPIQLIAKVDRTENVVLLSWDLPFKSKQIRLYKATGSSPISLYKSFAGDIDSFIDQSLTINSEYTYLVQFIATENQGTRYSNELKILF